MSTSHTDPQPPDPPAPPTPEEQAAKLSKAEKASILREAVSYYLRTTDFHDQAIRIVCEEYVASVDNAAREAAGTGGASGYAERHHSPAVTETSERHHSPAVTDTSKKSSK